SRKEVAIGIEQCFPRELEQIRAEHGRPGWHTMNCFDAQVGNPNVVPDEVLQLLDPLLLDVLFRSDDQQSELWVEMAKNSERAERNVSLSEADFICEIRDFLLFEN